jgi:hypothetical protein
MEGRKGKGEEGRGRRVAPPIFFLSRRLWSPTWASTPNSTGDGDRSLQTPWPCTPHKKSCWRRWLHCDYITANDDGTLFDAGLSGAVDILVHHRAPLPKDAQYLIGALAFIVEALLFMFHLHGRTQFDIVIHTLLLYVVYGNIIVTLVEMRYRNSVTVSLVRTYLLLLQGTWFWQAGFLLYNPLPGAEQWHAEDHNEIMVVTMMFAWHMAAIFIIMMIIGSIVAAMQSRSAACCGSKVHLEDSEWQYDSIRLLHPPDTNDTNGRLNKTTAELDTDSEDVDFDRSATRKSVAVLDSSAAK